MTGFPLDLLYAKSCKPPHFFEASITILLMLQSTLKFIEIFSVSFLNICFYIAKQSLSLVVVKKKTIYNKNFYLFTKSFNREVMQLKNN